MDHCDFDNLTPERLRELGKTFFFDSDEDPEKRETGLQMILRAQAMQDPEAMFLVARFLIDGVISFAKPDSEEHALEMLWTAAKRGYIQARRYLNAFCGDRYRKEFETHPKLAYTGPLVGFDGKPIKINRKGILTPVDAVLSYQNGHNVLTLQANVDFSYGEEPWDPEDFELAVLAGMRAWEGEYEVFGGQKLTVKVELTKDDRWFDNVLVVPVTAKFSKLVHKVSRTVGTKANKVRINKLLRSKRSFATAGLRKWSVTSRKIIFIQSATGQFHDYEEIKHVAKHEFGHALGLGDLYANPEDHLPGVKKGTYPELDCYAVGERCYNLVMCDHHGPISNNDIEMVVLAFAQNQMQLYQPGTLKGRISFALGRGD